MLEKGKDRKGKKRIIENLTGKVKRNQCQKENRKYKEKQ